MSTPQAVSPQRGSLGDYFVSPQYDNSSPRLSSQLVRKELRLNSVVGIASGEALRLALQELGSSIPEPGALQDFFAEAPAHAPAKPAPAPPQKRPAAGAVMPKIVTVGGAGRITAAKSSQALPVGECSSETSGDSAYRVSCPNKKMSPDSGSASPAFKGRFAESPQPRPANRTRPARPSRLRDSSGTNFSFQSQGNTTAYSSGIARSNMISPDLGGTGGAATPDPIRVDRQDPKSAPPSGQHSRLTNPKTTPPVSPLAGPTTPVTPVTPPVHQGTFDSTGALMGGSVRGGGVFGGNPAKKQEGLRSVFKRRTSAPDIAALNEGVAMTHIGSVHGPAPPPSPGLRKDTQGSRSLGCFGFLRLRKIKSSPSYDDVAQANRSAGFHGERVPTAGLSSHPLHYSEPRVPSQTAKVVPIPELSAVSLSAEGAGTPVFSGLFSVGSGVATTGPGQGRGPMNLFREDLVSAGKRLSVVNEDKSHHPHARTSAVQIQVSGSEGSPDSDAGARNAEEALGGAGGSGHGQGGGAVRRLR